MRAPSRIALVALALFPGGTALAAPPSFGAVPDRTVTEGTLLLFQLPATDPDGDALTFSLVSGPAGMAVTSGGTLGWVPAYSQSAGGAGLAHTVEAQVADAASGSDTVTFTVRSQWKDDDGDGMADTWEAGHGMDPTIDDSLGDADGDGVLNIDEFNGLSPGGVTPLSPLSGDDVNVEDPVLVVQNTTVGDSGALTCVFQLFSDASLAMLVHEGSAVEDSSGTTSFTLDDTLTDEGADGDDPADTEDVDLADDAEYWWRARAFDGTHAGPWSVPQRFRYDPTNDPPHVASNDTPVEFSSVSTLSPMLVAGNPAPDDDPAATSTVRFAVFDGDPNESGVEIRSSGELPMGGFGTTSWVVVPSLPQDDQVYFWRVVVTDARGGSAYNGASRFTVNLANDAPTLPAIVAPQEGASVDSSTPTVVATGASDADGDALEYAFDIDVSPAFNSAAKQSGSGTSCGIDGADRCFTPSIALAENGLYWCRVRVTDGSAYGDAAITTFRVDLANDAPGVPVPVSPSGSLVITTTPSFVALLATDPEDEPLTYDFQVLDEDGAVAAEEAGVAPAGSSVTWTPPADLDEGSRYTWQVRAVDERALAGAWSASASFEVYRKPSGGAGGGGGCSVSSGGNSPAGMWVLLAGLALFLRRRDERKTAVPVRC